MLYITCHDCVCGVFLKTNLEGQIFRIIGQHLFSVIDILRLSVNYTDMACELHWILPQVLAGLQGEKGFACPAVPLLKRGFSSADIGSVSRTIIGSAFTTRVSECFMKLSHCMVLLWMGNYTELISLLVWWCCVLFSCAITIMRYQ